MTDGFHQVLFERILGLHIRLVHLIFVFPSLPHSH